MTNQKKAIAKIEHFRLQIKVDFLVSVSGNRWNITLKYALYIMHIKHQDHGIKTSIKEQSHSDLLNQ